MQRGILATKSPITGCPQLQNDPLLPPPRATNARVCNDRNLICEDRENGRGDNRIVIRRERESTARPRLQPIKKGAFKIERTLRNKEK